MFNILVTRKLPIAVEERASATYSTRLNADDSRLSADGLVEQSRGCDAILCAAGDPLNADTISRLDSSVKVIATFSVGFEHVDVAAAAERGIVVCNTPDVLSRATAEITMLLMLMAARRAGEAERIVRAKQWSGWAPTQLVGTELSGKRLGIFGMGRIGAEVARMARGFSMEVHYRNRRPSPDAGDAQFHDSDESFLRGCDFLALNAPSTPETHNWLNSERIRQLPRGAIVVNTARGTLVDDDAVIQALESGHLAAVGLDVFRDEPRIDPRYLRFENAVLLPHIGSATREARDAMGFLALDGIDAVLAGREPANRVSN